MLENLVTKNLTAWQMVAIQHAVEHLTKMCSPEGEHPLPLAYPSWQDLNSLLKKAKLLQITMEG